MDFFYSLDTSGPAETFRLLAFRPHGSENATDRRLDSSPKDKRYGQYTMKHNDHET